MEVTPKTIIEDILSIYKDATPDQMRFALERLALKIKEEAIQRIREIQY